jgi:MFS family permease
MAMKPEHGTLRESLRALPRAAWILYAGTFLNKFGTFVMPFLAIYLTRLGYSLSDAGLALSAYGLGHMAAAGLGGHLADVFGRRRTIVLSMFSGALTMLCLSQARGLPAIVGFAGLAGMTTEMYRPASSALLADLVPEGRRVTAFAAYRLAFNAGFAFGPATAGLLAGKSFVWLFVGDAITSMLYGIIALLALPRDARRSNARPGAIEILGAIRQDGRFVQLLCGVSIVGLVFMQIVSTFSVEVTNQGFSPATYGMLISLNGVLVVLFELPITTVTRRFPVRPTIALGYILIGCGFGLNALARSVPVFALAVGTFTLGEMISMPVASAYVADLAPAHLRGRYMGAFGLTWAAAFVTGPTIGLWVFANNHSALWLSCALLGLGAAAIVSLDPQRFNPSTTIRIGDARAAINRIGNDGL